MSFLLKYGQSGQLAIEPSASAEVIDCTRPRGVPIADPASAMTAALQSPLKYPSLASSTVPGDRITIAVEPGLPSLEAIVAGALLEMLERGTDPRDITIVVGSNLRPPLALVPTRMRKDLRVVLHNPSDQEGLQYLAADKEARPIYLNRALCEADFVLPISASRLTTGIDYVGGYSGVFPVFADLETQQRYRAGSSADHAVHQRHRREEADGAAWQLGLHFITQVVPGQGDEVFGIIAGEAESVIREAQRQHAAAWLYPLPGKVSLAIAAIEGGEEQQTWEHLARALDVAQRTVSDGGAIIIVSDLTQSIGPALAALAGNERDEDLSALLAKECSADAHAATLLASVRERFDLFLWSGLQAELVEELGLAPIGDASEVNRIVRRYSSLVLLGSAQYAGVHLDAAAIHAS